jgi:IS1 family transposase
MLGVKHKSSDSWGVSKLPLTKCAQILSMLCEGSSMRSTSRVVDVSINTMTKTLVDAGEACAAHHDATVRGVKVKRVQRDEIWSFCYSKQKNVATAKRKDLAWGDVWTWTAIEADSKLLISYMVGGRDADYALGIVDDLRQRIDGRMQLTTDGHAAYLSAVEEAFGSDIDYAMLVKLYGTVPDATRGRYSPAECIGAWKEPITGNPDRKHVSTSYIERANLTMRMAMRRFTRLTNAFSKKFGNRRHMVALYATWYNFIKQHKTLKGITLAMAAGVSDKLWSMENVVALIDARAAKPVRPATYRKRGDSAEIAN